MNEEKLKFIDDKLFVYTPLPQYGNGVCEVRLVMTKEIFQECYKRWIKEQEERQEMNKKLAELTVKTSADYYNKVVKALEDAGFVLVLDYETLMEKIYIVAEGSKND